MNTKLRYIFVHGLSGWGSYDEAYQRTPYWGMRGGDLMVTLLEQGYVCRAASVAPTGSAWDRACELYAQLAGTKTDYGEVHSQKYRHERFGRDFSSEPLIPDWEPDTKLVLLGHSFGGATIRLFAHLLAYGDEEEREGTLGELSALFAGGLGERVHSIVTLAAPTNGANVYDMHHDPDFDLEKVRVPWWSKRFAAMLAKRTKPQTDGRDERDFADFDIRVDNAQRLNAKILTQPSVYYFAVPCSYTKQKKDGSYKPKRRMEPLLVMRSWQIGAYTGKTKEGMVIGDEWRENDGLVNTISAAAPFGAPSKALDKNHIEPGVWNIFPVYDGDHLALQGGFMFKRDVRGFYLDLLKLIDSLA